MPKNERSEGAPMIDMGVLKNLTAGELQDLTRVLAELAVEAREEGRGREIPKREQGGPKDAVVQRIAGDALRLLIAPKSLGGKGMSLRDVASMYGVTYERIRTLAQALVSDYEDLINEKRRKRA